MQAMHFILILKRFYGNSFALGEFPFFISVRLMVTFFSRFNTNTKPVENMTRYKGKRFSPRCYGIQILCGFESPWQNHNRRGFESSSSFNSNDSDIFIFLLGLKQVFSPRLFRYFSALFLIVKSKFLKEILVRTPVVSCFETCVLPWKLGLKVGLGSENIRNFSPFLGEHSNLESHTLVEVPVTEWTTTKWLSVHSNIRP